MKQLSSTSTWFIVSSETPGRITTVKLETPSPISQVSIPAPSQTLFYPSTRVQVQENASNVMCENASFYDDSQRQSYYLINKRF